MSINSIIMARECIICKVDNSKYKCPICVVYYCSVECCNKHRQYKCDVVTNQANLQSTTKTPVTSEAGILYPTADTVKLQKLQSLENDTELKEILENKHLRALIVSVNESENPADAMANAMQEPIFVEFANACLALIDDTP